MKPIGYIECDLPTKFGVPRQSGLVPALKGRIVFGREYSRPEAFRGLTEFSHIWVLWEFSEAKRSEWSPTVRPPRLGGNRRIGVFATRSPFRPNSIGLSCVKLDSIVFENDRAVLNVSGIDMMNGTPVFDIKPYIPVADCITDAAESYTAETKKHRLDVIFPDELISFIPEEKREALISVLAEDPRPSYIDDSERVFGVEFAEFDIRFRVNENTLTVIELSPRGESPRTVRDTLS